jgi:hypothetical protein
MNRTSHVYRQIISVVCITVFALTSVPLVTDSIAAERERRRSSDNRLEQTRGERVERDRSRTSDNRVERTRGERVERDRSRRSDNRIERTQERRVERSLPKKRWKNKRRVISPRSLRDGHVVRRLPRGYKRTWYKSVPYYYSHGVFYRPGLSGYVVVRAPIGAIVLSLPVGYQRFWIGGSVYYAYGGYFYRSVPRGFVVVEPPETIEFEEVDPDVIQPSQIATGEVSVTVPVLNVRSGPSLSDPKIYQIHKGYILEIHGKTNGWLYVQLPNGEFGWVKSVYTRPLEPASG